MPPSPSIRCSPRRELSIESNHIEVVSRIKAADDELALFSDMQMRERDNFLLHSTDDFEDPLSKLNYFPDFKLNIPVRGASSDLLNVESEKNDYDWLLTPPDTPLFPSLDDEEPLPVNLASGSKSPTQPITISRSSMTGKSHRTSRRSESPHRLSPSPRSGSSMPQPGGRPSYSPHSSPTTVSRATPSWQKPASPSKKPTTSTPRSSTQTLRRMTGGSSGNMSSSARKGISPMKANRGNSASPKLRGWQTDLPGFSADPPPNLRTSLPDWTASHSRSSSPAHRSRGDSPLRSGRQSMSPTSSRSVTSSHSHERDHFSAHSKGSVASHGDDDVDSLYSVNAGIPSSMTLRKNRVLANSRDFMFSKKPSRALSASSAPHRSFDSIIKRMDNHKSPQNMFRPLLSSVPSSTFYSGKANIMHCPPFSRNSSLTTSSNASSELGASIALDNEGSDHDQNNYAGQWEIMLDAGIHEDIFVVDKMDEIVDVANDIGTGKSQNIHGIFGRSMGQTMESEGLEQLTSGLVDIMVKIHTSESSYDAGDHCHIDSTMIIATCRKCHNSLPILETANGNFDVCKKCLEKDESTSYKTYPAAAAETAPHTSHNSYLHPGTDVVVDASCEKFHVGTKMREITEETNIQSLAGECQNHSERVCHHLPDICPTNMVTSETEPHPLVKDQPEAISNSDNRDGLEGAGISILLLKGSNSGKGPIVQGRSLTAASVLCVEPSYTRDNMNALKVSITRNSSSVDLGSSRQLKACMQQQLNGSKADPVMGCIRSEHGLSCQSTEESCSCGASNNLCEDLTHTKFLCTAHKGTATSKSVLSVDLGTSRQTEAGIQRQSSCSKLDMECVRIDLSLETHSTETSLSGVSCKSQEDLSPTYISKHEEQVSGYAEVPVHVTHGEFLLVTEEKEQHLEKTESCGAHTRTFLPMEDEIVHGESCRILDSSPLLLRETQNTLENASASDTLNEECCASSVYSETHLSQDSSDAQEGTMAKKSGSCPFEEDELMNNSPCGNSFSEAVLQSSLGAKAILEDEHDSLERPLTASEGSQSLSNIVESSDDVPISTILEENVLISSLESNDKDIAHGIHGEPSITVEGPGGNKFRCLTLEEATDTILFCSSIVHDLAFKAAAIGMEKEDSTLEEAYWPTAITLGKSTFDEKHQRRTPPWGMTKLPKARRMLEMDAKVPAAEPENNTKITKSPALNPELSHNAGTIKPVKLESKCNCTVM